MNNTGKQVELQTEVKGEGGGQNLWNESLWSRMKHAPDIERGTGPEPPRRRRGAQPGNRLAFKHGRYRGEMIVFKARVRTLMREINATLAQVKAERRANALQDRE
jgi:hypothetical protein